MGENSTVLDSREVLEKAAVDERLLEEIARDCARKRISKGTDKDIEDYITSLFVRYGTVDFEHELKENGCWTVKLDTIKNAFGQEKEILAAYEFIQPLYDKRKKKRYTSKLPEISHHLNVAFYAAALRLDSKFVRLSFLHDYIEDACEDGKLGKLETINACFNRILDKLDRQTAQDAIILANLYSIIIREAHDAIIEHKYTTPEAADMEFEKRREGMRSQLEELLSEAEQIEKCPTIAKRIRYLKDHIVPKVHEDDVESQITRWQAEYSHFTEQLGMLAYRHYIKDLVNISMDEGNYGLITVKNLDRVHNIETMGITTVITEKLLRYLDKDFNKTIALLELEGRSMQQAIEAGRKIEPALLLSYRMLWSRAENKLNSLLNDVYRDSSFKPAQDILIPYQTKLADLKKDLDRIFYLRGDKNKAK